MRGCLAPTALGRRGRGGEEEGQAKSTDKIIVTTIGYLVTVIMLTMSLFLAFNSEAKALCCHRIQGDITPTYHSVAIRGALMIRSQHGELWEGLPGPQMGC